MQTTRNKKLISSVNRARREARSAALSAAKAEILLPIELGYAVLRRIGCDDCLARYD
jgi:hypothetical protein